MYTRILVPLDLTDRHERAVEAAAAQAAAGGGTVELLHVVEEIVGLPQEEERAFYRRLEAAARRQLGGWGKLLAAHKVQWQAQVTYGSRAREILRRAAEGSCDLIVLSSHKVDPNRKGEGLGTLSYQLGILAPCSVLLVK